MRSSSHTRAPREKGKKEEPALKMGEHQRGNPLMYHLLGAADDFNRHPLPKSEMQVRKRLAMIARSLIVRNHPLRRKMGDKVVDEVITNGYIDIVRDKKGRYSCEVTPAGKQWVEDYAQLSRRFNQSADASMVAA